MNNDELSISLPHLDVKALSRFLFSFNVVRHHSEIYPEDHPLVSRSLQRVVDLLGQVLQFEETLVLGVARDKLLVAAEILDRRNAIYRDLAASLFACDIASITFHRALPSHELWELLQGLRLGREGLYEHGGISPWLSARGVRRLEVRQVDYLSFRTTDEAVIRLEKKEKEPPGMLWLSLAEGMMREAGGLSGSAQPGRLTPETVARLLNERIGEDQQEGDGEEYERAIATFLQQIDRENLDTDRRNEPLEKLNAFFGRLVPEIRRKFLSSTFRHLEGRRDLARDVLAAFPEGLVLQTLEEIEEEKISVPPLVLELLGQFSAHDRDEGRQVAAPELAAEELKTRIQTLFREDRSDRFVTQDYGGFIRRIQSSPRMPVADPAWTERMVRTLENRSLERQLCSVILQIERESSEPGSQELQTNLTALIDFFMDQGDMGALVETHDRLAARADEEAHDAPLAREGLSLYRRGEFVEAILEGTAVWNRQKLPEVQALIASVGSPFVEPLLDRLASEPEMSKRRFYIECLVRLRQTALGPVCARLGDSRWYFVRNLVLILRRIEDPSVLDSLEKVVFYPHARVQTEVMRTFHDFCDPRGDRRLLAELESGDPARRGRAIQAARWSFTPDVFSRLTKMLGSGFSEEEYPEKSMLVRTLAEIGTPATIAGLAGLLEMRSLFHRAPLRRLKSEAVEALGRYPSEPGRELLQKLLTGKGEMAQLAGQSLRRYRVKTP